jgi:radical SAM superfamily enzyme YgiQ (UPF0313 family)
MKLSVINPPHDIMISYGSKRNRGKKIGYWPSFGVAVLAGGVKKIGWDIEYLDCPIIDYGVEDIVRHLEQSKPDVIGISSLLATREQIIPLIRALDERFKAPIFLGGLLATSFGESVMVENPGLDFAVVGEAEQTIVEVLKKIERGDSLKGVRGLCYRDNGRIVRTEPRPVLMNMDLTPSPEWSICDLKKYYPLPMMYKRHPVILYMASRGCPYGQCTFCYEAGSAAPIYRRHSPERVVRDMKEAVVKFGVREVAFWDDIFLVDESWVLKFCELLRNEGLEKEIVWQAYGYAGTLTKKMVDAAARAGCWNVYLGFESANQDVLDRVKKGVKAEQTAQAIKWVLDAGMDARGTFILSLPGESPEKAMNSVRFAIENKISYVMFYPYFPEYGTPLYYELVQEGKVIDDVYKGRGAAQYVPEGYRDAEEVNETVRRAYRKFYLRPSYILHRLSRIRTWEDIKQHYNALQFVIGLAFNQK